MTEEEMNEKTPVEETAAEETEAEAVPAGEPVADSDGGTEAGSETGTAPEATAEVVEEAVEEMVEEIAAPEEKEKKSDLPPGADLEPISIEPETELSAEERARLEAEEEERAEREAAAEQEEDEAPLDGRKPVKLDRDARFMATGKRKSSVARVIVRPGDGRITVNDREVEEYFPRDRHRTVIGSPLVVTGYESAVDVRVRVHGGGISGQAGAIRHGIARALTEADPELRSELKRRGFLTRDARAKERRKAGLKKARKRPQFSKR